MHVIEALNIRDALPRAVALVMEHGIVEETRLGTVTSAAEPVTIHYQYPKQHVLLNPVRDANPFFHLMEAMWMLAGRQDGAFLDHYVKGFSEKYGSYGIIMDAYGFRWKYGFRFDQLKELINQLRKNPSTRQAVLQMWNGSNDLRSELAKPCNLVITFRIVGNALDMTVFNRSNDLIWGCCGANAVHFPILQEYMASKVGVVMGEYWQVSTNLHFYKDHYEMLQKRADKSEQVRSMEWHLADITGMYGPTMPLMEYPEQFDTDLGETMAWLDEVHRGGEDIYTGDIANPFLRDVVIPMARAHHLYKKKCWTWAAEEIESVKAEDWKQAGKEWLERRHASGR